ncbi:MAG: glycerol-3-phosphate dehydrogenase/oxidase, partial [Chloroflexi bacterium]|nr:glycerol-3-phosphate dehydrogenase/oxidase [Chloroflexota bacterium]
GLLSKPAERGAVIIKLGLMMYDFYVRGDSPMPGHKFNKRKEALKIWPAFNPEILFTATYYDGGMHSPERLALEILMDGEAEGDHARAINYVSAIGSAGDQILLRDEISGESFSVTPEIVINAGGPWIDFINQDIASQSNFIGGTKGSHLVVDHPGLRKAIGNHEIFFEYVDGRIVLIFPYLDDHVMIGSTDLRIDNPDQAVCTEEEIDYILSMVPQIFPDLNVTRDQIIFQFSGVRPLPVAKGSTGQISRDHSIELIPKDTRTPWPILNLVGGKWTSYRVFAEQVTDQVLNHLSKSRKLNTSRIAIGGGKTYPVDDAAKQAWIQRLIADSGFSDERVDQLFERYGTRTSEVLSYLRGKDDSFLKAQKGYSKAELDYLVEKEMVTHLDDFLLRRSKAAWIGQVSEASVKELAGVIGELLNWSSQLQQSEIERTLRILREKHAVRI